MSTKYILDPSGNIIKIENGSIERKNLNNKDKPENDYLIEVNKSQNVVGNSDNINQTSLRRNRTGFGLEPNSPLAREDEIYILGKSNNDPSFGFTDPTLDNTQKSFKPFNSITEKEDRMPKVFADEFEMLTGMRLRGDEFTDDAGEVIGLLFTYIAESVVRIATLEAIVALNQLTSSDRNETYEKYNLRLGKYDFDDFDIFTKYVFNVLNYPHENSTIDERLAAYFFGFASWLSPDMVFDINKFIDLKTDSKNSIDFFKVIPDMINPGFDFSVISIPREAHLLIDSALSATIEATASAFTNTTVINRVKLLLRKFYQEKHWNSNLYNAKDKNLVLDWFTDLNYYYFRFYIERVQVGLKLLDYYYDRLTYMDTNSPETPLTRVSGNRSHADDSVYNTIVSGKEYLWKASDSGSNKSLGQKPSLPTRIRALPQGLNLNHTFYKSLALNNKNSISLDNSLFQNFYTSEERRLPSSLVREIEHQLESEYMPFYFHDLRTNEIISFHAFIENISDSFTPDYNSASGFGRIDEVRSYVKTTRNINLSFILAATSETDHDLMWYQINKVVAMCYPQWSDAFSVQTKDKEGNILPGQFKYPFTQVPTASPLIRLRVGDLIKSNYSRVNLSRLHGLGDREGLDKEFHLSDNLESFNKAHSASRDQEADTSVRQTEAASDLHNLMQDQVAIKKEMRKIDENLKIYEKAEVELDEILSEINAKVNKLIGLGVNVTNPVAAINVSKDGNKATFSNGSDNFVTFYANKLIAEKKAVLDKLDKQLNKKNTESYNKGVSALEKKGKNKEKNTKLLEKKKEEVTKLTNDLVSLTKKNAAIRAKIKKMKSAHSDYLLPGIYKNKSGKRAINITHETPIVEILSTNGNIYIVKVKFGGRNYELFADSNKILKNSLKYFAGDEILSKTIKNTIKDADRILKPVHKDQKGNVFSNNPITRAYESGMSRGLAGFITNLDLGYNESTWETSRIGSKAPILVKVNIAFSPIHDIPPGLDHNGMLRAPVYNVGKINNQFFGDPHDGYSDYSEDGITQNEKSEYKIGRGRSASLQKYERFMNAKNKNK